MDPTDQRTIFAADRTILARERSYGAWMRTGLTALAAGVGARALLTHDLPLWLAVATGVVLILFSGFCFFAAVWRELSPNYQEFHPDERRLPGALFVAFSGFLMAVAVAVMIAMIVMA